MPSVNIEKADNGIIVEFSNGCYGEYSACKMIYETPEETSNDNVVFMLYDVLEAIQGYQSKHHKKRIKIELVEQE
jgi:hypothetical protein